MKKRNCYSRNRKEIKSSKCFSCPLQLEPTLSKNKLENLNIHKEFLEDLLSGIKACEIAVLSIKDKSKNNNKKKILFELKENLNQAFKEKNKNLKNIENEFLDKKKDLQNKIFNEINSEYVNNDIINENKKIIKPNIKFELFLLNTLNFMAQNYIEQIDNLILKKTNEYNYIKLCMQYTSIEEKEIECHEQKYYPLIIKILHKKIYDVRKKFKLVVSAKQSQNDEIENTTQNLTELKKFISKKKNGYLDNKEIIQEESKEFTQSITLNKMTNNINNSMNIYNNKNQKEENEYGDNIIIIDNIEDESFDSNALSDSSKKDKCKDININNTIQQIINFNMNINFNVNYNKFFGNDYVIYNSERNFNDIINSLNTNKKKKGLSSTGSLPNINNSIKDDSIEMSINESKNNANVNDTNSICKINNSKDILKKNYLVTN